MGVTPSQMTTETPQTTDAVCVTGRCGETVGVYAYPGTVVCESDDGSEMISAHMPAARARQYAAAILAACDDAERMKGE